MAGLLVTAAATAGPVEGGAGELLVELSLTNAAGNDLQGIELRSQVPAATRVSESWQGGRDRNPAAVSGRGDAPQMVRWSGIAIRQGERLAPFTFRVTPRPDADGATAFRDAVLQPSVGGAPGNVAVVLPQLPLLGLWGENRLRRTVLPSGLTVLTRERPDTDTVALRLAVRAGSRDEDDTTSGGSHWLEHAYFLGTETRPSPQAIDNAVSAVGGATNASTSWEFTDYWKLVPAESFELALDVLADQLLHSTFRAEAFERERRVVFEELKQRNDAAGTRAFDEFIQAAFRDSPLRRHPGGTVESVETIPIPVILAHRDRLYRTGNMAIAAIGRLTHTEAVARIEAALAGLPRGPRSERPPAPEQVQREPRRIASGDGQSLAEVRLGWPTPGDLDADAAPLYILEDILGATGRRLTEEIRDRRALATSVSPAYLAFSDGGALMIAASTQPDRVDEVVRLAVGEVQRLRDGAVSAEDVAASLRAVAGRRSISDELNQDQATRASAEVSGTIESFDEYLARLRRVRPADVQRVARTYLDPASFTLVVVRR
jgi:predicted Zn-dependent peptidase